MKKFSYLVILLLVLLFVNDSIGGSVKSRPPVKNRETYFTSLPESFTRNPSFFTSFWARAATEPLRIAVFGDSQETAPGGSGNIYIPRLNYEMYLRFGQVSETMISTNGGFGSGSPYGSWLLSGNTAPPGPSASRVDSTYLLPGFNSLSHSTKNNLTNVNGQAYGQLLVLRHDGSRLHPDAQISADQYFCFGTSVKAEIIAATDVSSGEIRVLGKPSNSVTGNFFDFTSINQQIIMGLESPSLSFKSAFTNTLPLNGFTYHQIEINGDTDAKLTNVVGARFMSESCNQGVVIQPLGVGGYQITHHLNNHANAGQLFKLLEFDAAIIHLGANDGGNDISADTYKANLLTLINRIRTWQEDPNFPIFLLTDIYRTALSANEQIDYDKYPLINYQIASTDPYIKFVNSRLLAHNAGLTPGNTQAHTEWLTDGIHYTGFGARKLAELEAEKLVN